MKSIDIAAFEDIREGAPRVTPMREWEEMAQISPWDPGDAVVGEWIIDRLGDEVT